MLVGQRVKKGRDRAVYRDRVLEFLWKGSPDPSLVQRIGAFLVGLFFMSVGVNTLTGAIGDRCSLLFLPALCLLTGAKVFGNGFGWRFRTGL